MPTTDKFAIGRDQAQAFKHAELVRYACAFVAAGLALMDRGTGYVGSDDVGEEYQAGPDGPGIAGSAVTMLRNAGVIEDYWGNDAEAVPPVRGGRRRSKRESANGRRVPVYGLSSRSLAETFLRRNGWPVSERQGRLAL